MAFSVPAAVSADANNIQIQLPANGDRDWGTNLRDLAWVLLANHDHDTAGGQPISGGALAASSVTGPKILLDNDTYLRWKNSSATATDVIKLAADDKIEIAQDIDILVMSNDKYIQARNNAGSADVNILKLGTDDNLDIDPDVDKLVLSNNVKLQMKEAGGTARALVNITASDAVEISDANVGSIMRIQKETLADNVSATDVPDFAVLGTDETAHVFYKIVRNGAVQMGTLWVDIDNTLITEDFIGDDVGVTFTNVAGQLKYATTSTGNTAVLKLMVLRG